MRRLTRLNHALEVESSCSQMRITLSPIRLSFRRTRTSRSRLVSIFSFQNFEFVRGVFRLQCGQPCQKQPSMKIARLFAGKKKSGRPGRSRALRFQPRIPALASFAATCASVERFPFCLTRDIKLARSFLDNGSDLLVSFFFFNSQVALSDFFEPEGRLCSNCQNDTIQTRCRVFGLST